MNLQELLYVVFTPSLRAVHFRALIINRIHMDFRNNPQKRI